MNKQDFYRFSLIVTVIIILLTSTGCGSVAATANPSQPTPSAAPVISPTTAPVSSEASTPQVPVSGSKSTALYEDNFTDPATGWSEDKFDNYFIGYHEPEYYHIEISSPNYKTTVFEPKKETFGDFTSELQVLAVSAKTAATGDFRYGLAFRRSGDQYYAFTVSPRTKKWYVLKSSPNQLTVLTEGSDPNIHELDTDDTLRVDAQGANFSFHINDQIVGEITDPDYTTGEVGFYSETFDATNTHIHFDDLKVLNFEAPSPQDETPVLYQDDFTNPTTGWTERKFDNYFIGYHEPEYYHIEISSPNYKTTVFEPGKQIYNDFTTELKVLAVAAKTSPEGDFRYGLAFRRSGDQYYAFVISPRTKTWFVLKSSPSGLEILQQGQETSIHDDLDTDDSLRVDAQGANFLFHLNDKLISQVSDADYTSGEIGFYVETVDATNAHIHFDNFVIRELTLDLTCNIKGGTVYVRDGPSKTYAQVALLSDGDVVKALGISSNKWVKIVVKGSEQPGWVSYDDGYMVCSPSIDLFPIVSP